MSQIVFSLLFRVGTSKLVSSIKIICPEDAARPEIVHFVLHPYAGNPKREAFLEFDTVESARDWRREFQGLPHP